MFVQAMSVECRPLEALDEVAKLMPRLTDALLWVLEHVATWVSEDKPSESPTHVAALLEACRRVALLLQGHEDKQLRTQLLDAGTTLGVAEGSIGDRHQETCFTPAGVAQDFAHAESDAEGEVLWGRRPEGVRG